jgi:hypothetical protein
MNIGPKDTVDALRRPSLTAELQCGHQHRILAALALAIGAPRSVLSWRSKNFQLLVKLCICRIGAVP